MPLSAQDHPRSHPFRRPYAPSSPPEEMKDYPSWLPWRRTCQDGEYWLTPCDYYSGKPLSAFSLRDPDRSMPQRYSRHRSKFSEEYALRYGWEGAGFLLTESDPFVAIRVHDYHPEGSRTIYRWAREIVTRLGGYTEEVLTRCDVRNYLLIIVRCYTSAHGWYGGDFGGRIKIDSSELYIPFTGRAAPLRLTQPEVLPVRAEELAELDQIFRQDASDAVLDRWPQVSLLTKQGSARAEAREAAREEELRRATASIPLTQYQQAAVSEADRLLRTARLKGRRSAKSGGVE